MTGPGPVGPVWLVFDEVAGPPCTPRRSGAGQMAADLALASHVAGEHPAGAAALRLYTWSAPALSLGRFQPEHDVDSDACAARGVEVVRRPTGGRALLHGGDLTYAVALPRPHGGAGTVDALYCRLAGGLRAGFALLGIDTAVASTEGDTAGACFASMRGSDLRAGGRKLCGSAQVHRGGIVLQHGSVLLRRLPFDETDLLRYPAPADRRRERERLRTGTVTLEELGGPTDPAVVATALAAGFADALGVTLRHAASSLLAEETLSTSS